MGFFDKVKRFFSPLYSPLYSPLVKIHNKQTGAYNELTRIIIEYQPLFQKNPKDLSKEEVQKLICYTAKTLSEFVKANEYLYGDEYYDEHGEDMNILYKISKSLYNSCTIISRVDVHYYSNTTYPLQLLAALDGELSKIKRPYKISANYWSWLTNNKYGGVPSHNGTDISKNIILIILLVIVIAAIFILLRSSQELKMVSMLRPQ